MYQEPDHELPYVTAGRAEMAYETSHDKAVDAFWQTMRNPEKSGELMESWLGAQEALGQIMSFIAEFRNGEQTLMTDYSTSRDKRISERNADRKQFAGNLQDHIEKLMSAYIEQEANGRML